MSSMAEENATVDVKPEVFFLSSYLLVFWWNLRCRLWKTAKTEFEVTTPALPYQYVSKRKRKRNGRKRNCGKTCKPVCVEVFDGKDCFFVGSHKTSEVFVWLFLILAERLYCNRECAPVLIFGTRRVECWKVLKPRSSGVRNLTSMWTLLLKFWYMADFGSVFHYTSWWIAFVPVTKSGLFSVCRLQSHKGYLQLRRLNFPSLQYQNAI